MQYDIKTHLEKLLYNASSLNLQRNTTLYLQIINIIYMYTNYLGSILHVDLTNNNCSMLYCVWTLC